MEDCSTQSPEAFCQAGTSKRRLMIGLYLAAGFLFWATANVYVPTLPTYVLTKSSSLAQVGIVLAMFGLWRGIIALPAGLAGNWLGWGKPFIVLGLAVGGAGAWLMGSANGVTGLALGRAMTGIATGGWVLIMTAFSGLFSPREVVRATVMITLAGSLGSMVGTALTGFLNGLGGYSLAFFTAAASAAVAILIVLPLWEVRRPRLRPSLTGIGDVITSRQVLLPGLVNSVAMYVSHSTRLAFVPVLAKELGASDVVLSVLASMSLGTMVIGNLIVTALVKHIAPRRVAQFGIILLALGAGGTALARTVSMIYVTLVFIGLGTSFTFPVLVGMTMRQAENERRGIAVGLNQALTALGMFGGPWVSGMLADWLGMRPMFGVTAAMCLCLGLLGASRLSKTK